MADCILDISEVVTNSVFTFGVTTNKYRIPSFIIQSKGARGGAVGLGTALQAGRSRVRFLMLSLEFFIEILNL